MTSAVTGGRVKSATKTKADKKAKTHDSASWFGADLSNGYFLLLSLVAVLCAFGLMMVLSASSVDALRDYGSSWVFFKRQIIWLLMGIAILVFTLRIDYQSWRKWGAVT